MTSYPSKLLLFGEYTIIKGSQALAIPFPTYSGKWEYGGAAYELEALGKYLADLQEKGSLIAGLDVKAFQQALRKGLSFESTIPTGYGLGSSGALCAAIYSLYKTEEIPSDFLELKKRLAQIESFFHGSSSGIDPLVSFLQKGLWVKSKQELELIEANVNEDTDYSFFLIDTKKSRQTAPLVHLFNEKYKASDSFQKAIDAKLTPANNQAIACFLKKQAADLFEQIHLISTLQYEHFQAMIPEAFQEIWRKGIQSNTFKLKLCGAGGGGSILGYTNDFSTIKEKWNAFSIQKISSKEAPQIIKRIF